MRWATTRCSLELGLLAAGLALSATGGGSPPQRPLRLYGEVLVTDAVPAPGDMLVYKVGTRQFTTTTMASCDGRTIYEVLISTPATLPATITLVALGANPLSGVPPAPLTWAEGAQVRQDVRVTCSAALPPDVSITSATAALANGSWALTCQPAWAAATAPPAPAPSIMVLWYARTKTAAAATAAGDVVAPAGAPVLDHSAFPELVFMGGQTVAAVTAPVVLTYKPTGTLDHGDIAYLEVHVFAIRPAPANTAGAVASRAVVPTVTGGGL